MLITNKEVESLFTWRLECTCSDFLKQHLHIHEKTMINNSSSEMNNEMPQNTTSD